MVVIMAQTIAGVTTIGQYVDRGNVAPNDYEVGDFTTDGTWNTLDISGIVPAGAMLVNCRVALRDDVIDNIFAIRTNGQSNGFNISVGRIMIADLDHEYSFWVAPDASRVVEYNASNVAWLKINVNIRGWIIP